MYLLRLLFVVSGFFLIFHIVGASAETVVVEGGTIIDATGSKPRKDGILLIENGRIKKVGARGTIAVPAQARKIDATGKYVIPGLMDANAHLIYDCTTEFMARYEDRFEEIAEEAAQMALKSGITTIFASWGPLQVLKSVRNRINRGDTVGSRVFFAGNIVGYTGPLGRDFLDASEYTSKSMLKRINAAYEQGVGPELLYMTPEQVRAKIRAYLGKEVDFVKYGASNHKGPHISFSPRVQKVIVEEVHDVGKPVQVHSGTVESLYLAVSAGVDYLQHCDQTGPVEIPDETIQLMIEKNVICGPIAARSTNPTNEVNQRKMVQAGVTLALASDTGIFAPETPVMDYYSREDSGEYITELGRSHLRWLEIMENRGLSPMQNLQAATRNVAMAYHKLDDLGTLEPGKLADILILNANPLENVKNYGEIYMVIKEGREIERDKLPLTPTLTVKQDMYNKN